MRENAQAILFIVIFGAGMASAMVGAVNFRRSINLPFALKEAEPLAAISVPELSKIDTDKDGLSDYDETTAYGTSPYLTDTDSDGTSDAKEIEQGKNPNCPEGKTCALATTPGATATTGQGADLGAVASMSREEMTQKLLASGVPSLIIDGMSDSQLRGTFARTLNDTFIETGGTGLPAGTPSGTSAAPTTGQPAPTGEIPPLTAADIRELMKSQGMTDEQLSKLSDAELLQALEKTMQDIQSKTGQ